MTQSGELLAGMAEVDITPPTGHRMAGHFYEVLSTGTHDPLKAKALVLEQGNQAFAFAFCDVVSLSPSVTDSVRKQFSAKFEVPVENTLVAATHSHTGPLFNDPRHNYFHEAAKRKNGDDPHAKIDYSAFLTDSIVTALSSAYKARRSTDLSMVSVLQTGLAFNRRYHMKDGSVRFNPGQMNPEIVRPAGPTDPEIISLLIGEPDNDKLRGSLTVFANHCDAIGGTEHSADYPYYIEESLRERYGSDYISIFGQGTSGDVNHIDPEGDGPRKGVEISERIGSTIGAAILDSKAINLTNPSLAAHHAKLDLPLQSVSDEAVDLAKSKLPLLDSKDKNFMELVDALKALDLAGRGSIWPTEVQTFRLDEATAIVGLPGEIFTELGLSIKERSPFTNTMIVTLANDRLSYVPTKKAFEEESYEITNSRVQSGAGETLADTAVALLEDLVAEPN